jgi:hypothetical protein
MQDAEDDREARARARRQTWTGRLTTLGDDRPPEGRTIEERLALVAELSLRAWTLSGRPMPSYGRADMPGRVLRPGEGDPRSG